MGANPITFMGLSGVGDLILTCTGDLSRNRRVGLGLGQGRKLADILGEMSEVAEGVKTTEAVCRLADELGVDMPNSSMVRSVLRGEVGAQEAAELLVRRQLKSELD